MYESWSCSPHTDVRDKDNETLLHHACRGGSTEVVRYLVEEMNCDIGELFIIVRYHSRLKVGATSTLTC